LALGLQQDTRARLGRFERLSGGASQETWAFDLHADDGLRERLVLRRAPAAAEGTRSEKAGLAAEATLLGLAGAAGVPVPRVRCRLAPAHGLGDGFITEWLDGETLGARVAAAERPALARDCGQALARIHGLPLAGLPALRRTQPGAEVAHLRQWHGGHGTVRPVFQLALRWLAEHAPPDGPLSLVHGDFRNGNLMVDLAGGGRLRGVLDWELAHVGDPMADLGWLGVAAWRFGQLDRPVGGFAHWAPLLEAYAAAGGRLDLARLRWWLVLGTLRWGVICEGMGQAWQAAQATATPAMEKAAIARRASETEVDLLSLLAPLPGMADPSGLAPLVSV
jgi:aminoglycoside phosphotransferase (APT) family kinase protein